MSLVHIRWMIRRDLPYVVPMDGAWGDEDFLTLLRQRNCIGMVAEDNGGIHGFMMYELHRHHMTLLRFKATESPVALLMFAKLIYKLESHRRKRLHVSSNEMALFGTFPLTAATAGRLRLHEPYDTYRIPADCATSDVRALCANSRKVPMLPILADALRDGGCSDESLLSLFQSGNGIAAVATYKSLRPKFLGMD